VETDKHLLRYNDRGVVRSEAYYDGTYAEVDSSLIPVRSHHVFAGWSETSGSRRADILPGAEILMDRDIDLYPVFREDPSFMVNYLVDGRMVDYAMFYAGSVVAVGTESVPVREHFTLAGWSLDGETLDYPAGSTMVLRYDTDLHAVYVEDPRSVLTYADGARTIGSVELYSGEMVTVGDWVITDNDWRGFIGWRDSETSVVFKNGDRLTISRDTTLQAVWEEPVIVVEPSEDPPAEETPVEGPPAEDPPEEDTEPETVVPASDSPVEVRPDPIQFEPSEASGGKDMSRIAIVAGILVGVLTGTFAVTRYMRS
jgi:hypothetical protein